jgi:uncharacterized protein (DUF3084 family)
VYGKQHDDVRVVDYDAISMLNVSATQELAKQVDTLEQQKSDLQSEAKRLTATEMEQGAKIAALGSENENLKTEVAQLKSSNEKLAAMAAKIEGLEKVVSTIQQKETGGVRTVALESR